jgi:hypothetical protein
MYLKLVLNRLKVMKGPFLIYTPLGTKFKKTFIKAYICAPTKEAYWEVS